MNFKQIQQLIKFVSKTDVNEVTIENKDFKINIKGRSFSNEIVQPLIQQTLPPPQIQSPMIVPDPPLLFKHHLSLQLLTQIQLIMLPIKSPIIGTFIESLHQIRITLSMLVMRLVKDRLYV